MPSPVTYASVHRNVALLLGGLLLLIAGLVGGIAAALHTAANGDELLPLVFWVLGGFVVGFVLPVCFSLRHHRWTLTTTAVEIEERASLGFLGRSRRAEIVFGDVAGLATVQNGPHDVIELATRQGQRFRLGPTSRKPADHTLQGAIRAIDHEGLTAFAAQVLRLGIEGLVAGHARPRSGLPARQRRRLVAPRRDLRDVIEARRSCVQSVWEHGGILGAGGHDRQQVWLTLARHRRCPLAHRTPRRADVGQHESLPAIAFAPVDPSIQAGGVREFRGPLR